MQINFLVLAIASKKISKIVSESCTKWSQIGAVSESLGLADPGRLFTKCFGFLSQRCHLVKQVVKMTSNEIFGQLTTDQHEI